MKPDKKGPKKGKGMKKKIKKDPNEPPRPLSAYASFFRDTQAAIKGQNPDATFGEVSKIVASLWDSLDFEKKKEYKDKANEAKQEYIKILDAYKVSKAKLEEPDAMDLDPASDELQEYSNTSPVNQSSPSISESEIIETITVTKSETMSEIDQEPEDENDLEIIEPQKTDEKKHEILEECKNVPESAKADITDKVLDAKEAREAEQNGPCLVNGMDPITEPELPICIRNGCTNRAINSPEWDKEYCSTECVVEHCNAVFMAHKETRQKKAAAEKSNAKE